MSLENDLDTNLLISKPDEIIIDIILIIAIVISNSVFSFSLLVFFTTNI
ncbi:hypothetical protein [Staphylococcus pasteuri_A]|uniref:Uncharacterized protein n=1 Tax=Staphylococcus pasteuri_A TaxID=3062664 RepID=A0AAW7YXD0_9STAP|nr:hypothetical protein [Staphylococcus pasteuri_A]MDO6574913.1 hypothetical protein [Staphylococcus pasteuri_A]